MRITAEARIETRQNVVRAARKLFVTKGWDRTTTRGIAEAAGIATGTLFNYFDSKEAIVAELISDALVKAQEEVDRRWSAGQSIEEELFSLVWTELASLREYRKFLPAAAEMILSPLRRPVHDSRGDSIRNNHLEAVERLMARHGVNRPAPALTMQLYWTLYLGVFAHWASDESPKQEDTLALLDQSLKLFVALLKTPVRKERKKTHATANQRPHRGTAGGQRSSRRKR
jgi:AcrR family transcriptional regulator